MSRRVVNFLGDALPLFERGDLLQFLVSDAEFFVRLVEIVVRFTEFLVLSVYLHGEIDHEEMQYEEHQVVERVGDEVSKADLLVFEDA